MGTRFNMKLVRENYFGISLYTPEIEIHRHNVVAQILFNTRTHFDIFVKRVG